MPLQQQDIGSEYYRLERKEILERIAARKQELADNLLILCHHYQQQDLFQFCRSHRRLSETR